MNKKEILEKLLEAEKYFKDTEYQSIVELASSQYYMNLHKCEETLRNLPTREQLLGDLVEKLKGKSVYKTLKKIQEGCPEKSYTTLKGLTSLLTHILIEAEQGGTKFKILIPLVLEKINEMSYGLL